MLLFTTSQYLFELPCVCPHDWGVINATSMHCPCRRICSLHTCLSQLWTAFYVAFFYQKTNTSRGSNSPTLQVNHKSNASLIKSCFNMGMKCMQPLQNSLKEAVCELLKLQNRKLTHWCLSFKRKVWYFQILILMYVLQFKWGAFTEDGDLLYVLG